MLEVTHQDHSIGIALLLLVRATCIYIIVLRAHPVRGESHIQRNATGEVATGYIVIHFAYGDAFCRSPPNILFCSFITTVKTCKLGYASHHTSFLTDSERRQ